MVQGHRLVWRNPTDRGRGAAEVFVEKMQADSVIIGTDSPYLDAVSIYPNPFASEIQVTLPKDWDAEPVQLTLCDLQGRKLRQEAGRGEAIGATLRFPTQDIPPGIYILRIQAGTSPTRWQSSKCTVLKQVG